MLFSKNNQELTDELFQHPTSEYRGTPFWAWNCDLKIEELENQLDIFKKMGFGGAHLHVRTGLAIPYLKEEFMGLIKGCVKKAKDSDMLVWLYDEDRWPSGSAGGYVTRNIQYRAQHLLFTPFPYGSLKKETTRKKVMSTVKAVRTENGSLIACYDIHLDENGCLIDWKRIREENTAKYDKWYAYVERNRDSAWYNNQDYVNTLNKEAIDLFIHTTHDSYFQAVGEEFGKIIPAIFTDEPQIPRKTTFRSAREKEDVFLPWVNDLPESFYEDCHENLMDNLPELFWERADGKISSVRYHFHDHVSERFTRTFLDNVGSWCKNHGILSTGHMIGEESLQGQTFCLGDVMRCYRNMDLPGMDLLCAEVQFHTAKQVQSVVHQYGREGMISELYGVTNWDYDFRGHKFQGDWQAALGVTIRSHHLCYQAMTGESKRDYPASINYQSPWWEKYPYVEDYYSRLNTVLSRGEAVERIGVINPIETYWLHYGPDNQTALYRKELDDNYINLIRGLLFGGLDFDLISEALLEDIGQESNGTMYVGKMKYDAIVVPYCETLRTNTYSFLEKYAAKGGRIYLLGQVPFLENALYSSKGENLQCISTYVPNSIESLLTSLEPYREIELFTQSGTRTHNLLYQLRRENENRWLFVAYGEELKNKDLPLFQDVTIAVKGCWKPICYDALAGNVKEFDYSHRQGKTILNHRFYSNDSLLLKLVPCSQEDCRASDTSKADFSSLTIPERVEFSLSEPNVLLLDQCEYRLDQEQWNSREEILRLDDICRDKLGLPSRALHVVQPWVLEDEPANHVLHQRFIVHSQVEMQEVELAIENLEKTSIIWNGQEVSNQNVGWYVDRTIKKAFLPGLKKGDNVLEISSPFGKKTNVEWAYLLGNFGVEVDGNYCCIVAMKEKIGFSDITRQGFPFYGGNITYHIPISSHQMKLMVQSCQYRGGAQYVSLDEGEEQPIVFSPYRVEFNNIVNGDHVVHLSVYGNRRNSFGPVHLADLTNKWIGPEAWRTVGESWCYEYMTSPMGLLTSPQVFEKK